eukprot:6018104-Amphidinium_carterae.1
MLALYPRMTNPFPKTDQPLHHTAKHRFVESRFFVSDSARSNMKANRSDARFSGKDLPCCAFYLLKTVFQRLGASENALFYSVSGPPGSPISFSTWWGGRVACVGSRRLLEVG